MEKRDEELIIDYQSGNQEAFEVLFARYKTPIFNFALRMLVNRADAEDVTAEVFLILFSKKYTYQENAKFSTWLYTVARNNCIDKIRKRKRSVSMWFKKQGEEFKEWDVPDPEAKTDDALLNREKTIHVRKAISNLPGNQKEALILREYQKLNYTQISEVLDCSLDNVKILIYRARENLRTELSSFIKGEE